MNEWIKLADGTKIEDAYVVDLGDAGIAIYAKGVSSIRQGWYLFCGDQAERMHSYQYGDEADWIGYTEPAAAQENPDGGVIICLRRGDN